MDLEPMLRATFVSFVVVFAALLLARLRALGFSRDAFYTATEGLAVGIPIRVLLLSSSAGICAFAVDPAAMSWATLPLPAAVRWMGVPLGLAGLVLYARVLAALGRNFSLSLAIKPGHALVTEGPYRTVRHPMYTAFFLLCGSLLLLSANWFIGATSGLAAAIVTLVRTPKEEAMMLDQFGDRYRVYMERTGRLLPRWGL